MYEVPALTFSRAHSFQTPVGAYFCLFLSLLAEYSSAVLVAGLRKKGEKIVTCSKNSSPMAHHSGPFGIGHTVIYTS